MGGMKGKALSKQIENLFTEFTEFVTIFQNITYNCMDIKEPVSVGLGFVLSVLSTVGYIFLTQ